MALAGYCYAVRFLVHIYADSDDDFSGAMEPKFYLSVRLIGQELWREGASGSPTCAGNGADKGIDDARQPEKRFQKIKITEKMRNIPKEFDTSRIASPFEQYDLKTLSVCSLWVVAADKRAG